MIGRPGGGITGWSIVFAVRLDTARSLCERERRLRDRGAGMLPRGHVGEVARGGEVERDRRLADLRTRGLAIDRDLAGPGDDLGGQIDPRLRRIRREPSAGELDGAGVAVRRARDVRVDIHATAVALADRVELELLEVDLRREVTVTASFERGVDRKIGRRGSCCRGS